MSMMEHPKWQLGPVTGGSAFTFKTCPTQPRGQAVDVAVWQGEVQEYVRENLNRVL